MDVSACGGKRSRVEGKWVGCGLRKGRGQPERWMCSGCVGTFCADSPKRVQAPWSDVWEARCVWSLCGVSLWRVCALPPSAVGAGDFGGRGLLRPIHHPERIEAGGYGGVTSASAPRSYPLHFRPSRARPRRLPESFIHHRGRGHGGDREVCGGRGGGMQSLRADTREKHRIRRAQATRPGDACGAQGPQAGLVG